MSFGSDTDWRARAEALEAELAERAARTNEALADAQRRTYWLDRLHVDVNALMARPAARRLVGILPVLRELYRSGYRSREGARRLRDWRRSARAEAEEDAQRAQRANDAGGDLVDASAELLRRAGRQPGSEARALFLGSSSGSALEGMRARWPRIEVVADAAAAGQSGGFELVVLDGDSAGLGALDALLARDGRVLLATPEPAEAVLDGIAFSWAVLARRRLGADRNLYLLRRS